MLLWCFAAYFESLVDLVICDFIFFGEWLRISVIFLDFIWAFKILLYFALDAVNCSTFLAMCINFKVVLLFLKRALVINIFNEIAKKMLKVWQ